MKILAAFLFCFTLMASDAAIVPPKDAITPDQQTLRVLLEGNSLDGIWGERPFRQYFSASGSTKYQEGEGRVTYGTWRVNGKGHYCSIWPPSDREVCYQVLVTDREVYWVFGDIYYYSRVIDGKLF